MSKARHVSETPATQFLKQNKVAYTEHTYDYVGPWRRGRGRAPVGAGPARGGQDAGDGGRGRASADRGHARRSRSFHQESGAPGRAEKVAPLPSRRRSGIPAIRSAARRSARASACRSGSRPRCWITRWFYINAASRLSGRHRSQGAGQPAGRQARDRRAGIGAFDAW